MGASWSDECIDEKLTVTKHCWLKVYTILTLYRRRERERVGEWANNVIIIMKENGLDKIVNISFYAKALR